MGAHNRGLEPQANILPGESGFLGADGSLPGSIGAFLGPIRTKKQHTKLFEHFFVGKSIDPEGPERHQNVKTILTTPSPHIPDFYAI